MSDEPLAKRIKMVESSEMRFGPHSPLVFGLLGWIDRGELLRFETIPTEEFVVVSSFDEAKAFAQGNKPEIIDWTNIRDNADAVLYEVGLLDTEAWLPYKQEIKDLLFLISDKVTTVLPSDFSSIIDDVIGDLNACAICLAVQGSFEPFHGMLWKAYSLGGWPCGCTGEEPEPPLYDFKVNERKFYIFWKNPE